MTDKEENEIFRLDTIVNWIVWLKKKPRKKPTESSLAGLHVDSMQIYYTTDWLTNKVIDTLTTADPEEFYKNVNINDTTIARLENYFNGNIHKIKMY
ncbi:MAG: hypothetical protein IPL21_09855 [Saprospirales bacterium]|nr:hypothetical protein [Saprospirales bacterium]